MLLLTVRLLLSEEIMLMGRYYKRFSIEDMDRMQQELKQEAISIAHANNTLIVSVSALLNACCLAMLLLIYTDRPVCI